MKFEEALALLRTGVKITHPSFENDEYLQACYLSVPDFENCTDEQKLTESVFCNSSKFTQKRIGGMSIVKMKGDRQHKDMVPTYKPFHEFDCKRKDLHMYPQINLLSLMRDDWVEYIK